MRRTRVLFVAENVTLAQVVRLAVLARSLDPQRFDVHFACSEFDPLVFSGIALSRWPLLTVPRSRLEHSTRGRRMYSEAELTRYVAAERALLGRVQPDLVIGDFRPSLSVSCPLEGVPYGTFINAYWSPYAQRDGFPMPDHPLVSLFGERLSSHVFPLVAPFAFARFARPLDAVRRRHGLPSTGGVPQMLVSGDYALYPDVPLLVPTAELPPTHRFLGPVLWSPDVELPDWWNEIDQARPVVYVTLGSSGKVDLLPLIAESLADLPITVLLATAGRARPRVPDNFRVAELLPGHLAAQRAAFVISNGGSSTGYQALAEGTPVLGIAHNLDQYLAMTAIEQVGAGLMLRAGNLTREKFRVGVQRMLREPELRAAAARVAREFAAFDATARFREVVEEATVQKWSRPSTDQRGARLAPGTTRQPMRSRIASQRH